MVDPDEMFHCFRRRIVFVTDCLLTGDLQVGDIWLKARVHRSLGSAKRSEAPPQVES